MSKTTKKTIVIAIETSGRAGSVAIGVADKMLAKTEFSGMMRHSIELFTSIQQLLTQIGKKIEDIGYIYTSTGPGSFTGIRIAVTAAKMMALASDIKVVAANTMDVLAQQTIDDIDQKNADINRIGVIIDAKRKQFFIAVYEKQDNLWVKTLPDQIMAAEDFVKSYGMDEKSPITLLGEGLVYYKDQFQAPAISFTDQAFWAARAEDVYKVGTKMAEKEQFADPATMLPLYIRRPDAKVKQKK
jgi:tRNA threonylcarbamoyladenosine biosynthesis protein TsaB